jgi:hypothetical protein
MAMTTDTRDGITLSCSPSKDGDTVVFEYTLQNASNREAYVSDAAPRIDGKTIVADPDAVAVWLGKDRYANVLKGVAALPTERDIPGVVMPLMLRLAPGQRIERRLVLALPLAEHSPYYGIGTVRDYRLSDIEGVRLGIDVLPSPPATIPIPNRQPVPFAPTPVPYADGYVDIGVRGTLPLLRRLACSFRARGLHLMVRTAEYPRPD